MKKDTLMTFALLATTLILASDCWAAKKDGLNEAMMGEHISGTMGGFRIDSKESFGIDSREILWFASFKGFIGAPEARLTAEWITPAGETFKKEKFTTQYGNARFGWAKLDIKGSDSKALELEGEWTVRVYWDDELIDNRKFYLGERRFSKTPQADPVTIDAEKLTNADGYIRLAKVYYAKNDFDKAIDALLRAETLEPDRPSAYLILGSINNAIGKPDDAILQFSKAQSLKADPVLVHRGFAIAYTKLGLVDDAVNEYRAILAIMPDSKEDLDKLSILTQKKVSSELSSSTTQPAPK